MLIESDAGGWRDATSAFLAGNQRAALTATTLIRALAEATGMAGDDSTSSDFASAYDQAAQAAVDGLAELVDAFTGLARLTQTTGANHARAERASTWGCHAYDEIEPPLAGDCVTVPRVSLPSALGGEAIALPGGVRWVLDHIQGFAWPNADTSRLRATGHDWAEASRQLDQLDPLMTSAAQLLRVQTSPEIRLALAATGELHRDVAGLAEQMRAIGAACTAYADDVDRHRHAILTLVEDLLRDSVLVEGIGLVLGTVTAGLTAAGATALNAARIAAEAPRVLRLLDDLRDLVAAGANILRVTAAAIAPLTDTLVRLKSAHVLTAALTFAEQTPGGIDPDAPLSQGGGQAAVDLRDHERLGGHTIARHVGKSDAQLRRRLRRDRHLKYASSFSSLGAANSNVSRCLAQAEPRINAWLRGTAASRGFTTWHDRVTGRTAFASGQVHNVTGLRMILIRDDSYSNGYRIFTAFPTP